MELPMLMIVPGDFADLQTLYMPILDHGMQAEYLLPVGNHFLAGEKAITDDRAMGGDGAFTAARLAVVQRSHRDAERFQKLAVGRRQTNGLVKACAEMTGGHERTGC